MSESIIYLTDSYKITHWKQYPPRTEYIYSYLESRGGKFRKTVFYGLQPILQEYLQGVRVTHEDLEEAREFYREHFFGQNLLNVEGWKHIIDVHGGRLPVSIRAVPEGSVVDTNNVLITVENTDPKVPWITNFLETLLVQVWYPTTVATQSFYMKEIIGRQMDRTAGHREGLEFKLHDFGYRGVSSTESAGIGGAAHLVNFLGTDTVPGLRYAMKHYGDVAIPGYSIPACYDENTEILTEAGFVSFREVEGLRVAQYKEEGSIEFVYPTAFHCAPFDGNLISFTTKGKVASVDLLVTPNHRMVRRSISTSNIEVKDAFEAIYSHRNRLPQAGLGVGKIEEFTDTDALRLAFQADGSFVSRYESYTGVRTGCRPIRFHLSKQRKIDRLREILGRMGLEWRESGPDSRGYTHFWIKVPTEIEMVKDLSWINIGNLSHKWCRAAVEEIQHWDGQRKYDTIMYHSSERSCADTVQAIGILAGYRTSMADYIDPRGDRKTQFTVSIALAQDSRIGRGISKTEVPYSGQVYCVTVPSGMLVVRRNGCVAVSGNSEHSTITAWGKDNEAAAMENMLNAYPEGLVACVSDSYDIYNACSNIWGEQLRDKIMHRNGALVIRPDSGEPASVVAEVLNRLGQKFGYVHNKRGFKVLPPQVKVIQGDGVDLQMCRAILTTMEIAGWSAENIAFGMGGALLQKLDRDTQKFAFKCSEATVNGEQRAVFKQPVTDPGKKSKSGRLKLVAYSEQGEYPTYYTVNPEQPGEDQLVEVFRNGEVLRTYNFSEVRERVQRAEP